MSQILNLDARVLADIADAERAIYALNRGTEAAGSSLEILARLLLRAEAVGSSRIEGLVISPRRLAVAAMEPGSDPSGRAAEIMGNIHALEDALQLASQEGPFTVEHLCHIHRRLMSATRDKSLGGVVRQEQNWVGGYSPLQAEYVPPPPEEVPGLLADLCAYISGEEHSPLVQAALVHAQFETIHPFGDGNGRTGRALIHLVLRKRGICPYFVPPISLILATWSKRYIDALMKTRVEDPGVVEGWQGWLELVAQVTQIACAQARLYEQRIGELVGEWRGRVVACHGELRSDAVVWALLPVLPVIPILSVKSAAERVGRSERAVEGAVGLLVQAGVLKQVAGKLRNRLFEVVGMFDLLTYAERALASPVQDTKIQAPVRQVPARPMGG